MEEQKMKRQSSQGMALIIVLVVSVCMALIFSAVQFFSRSEYSYLEKVMINKSLDYLVRAGLNVAEDKLQAGRWYGDSAIRGTHTITDFPVDFLPGAKITIYADDYTTGEQQKIGDYMYIMLDHIKVFVEAKFRGETLYGYGKFIISPEPIIGGTSTDGTDPEFKILAPAPTTFKRMINVRVVRSSDLKGCSGYSNLSSVAARKAFAEFLKTDLDKFATNYSQNRTLSERIRSEYNLTKELFTQGEVHQKIAALDTGGGYGNNGNLLKNQFVLENFKRYFMSTNWDIAQSNKSSQLEATGVKIMNLPTKDMTNNRAQALAIIIGAGHPKRVLEGRDYWPTFSSGDGKSAAEAFLERRGMSSPTDTPPGEFAENIGRILTGNGYKYHWKCTQIQGIPGKDSAGNDIVEYTAKDTVGGGGDSSAAAFVLFFQNPGMWQPNGGVLEYAGVGPDPVYSNYYMTSPDGKKIPVASVLKFFLKYVDENNTYTPDDDGKNEGWWKMYIPPGTDPESASGGDSCCG